MKNILTYIGIASLILLTGCANNEVTEQDLSGKTSERTLTLTASMPTGRPETRLALTETDEGNMSVKWKEGDKISLCFVSGETVKTLSDIPVTNIREDGKKADFDFSLPEGIHYPFNLYGIYGATLATDSKTVTFPTASAGSGLPDTEPVCVMRFAVEDLMPRVPISVSLTHLGSLLSIQLTNSSDAGYTLTGLSLAGNEGYDWLYNASGQAAYDIVTGTFTDAKAGSALDFPLPPDGLSIAPGATAKVYGWIVPTAAPDASKTITATLNGTAMPQALPAKAFAAGNYYRLKLWWDGVSWKRFENPLARFATHNLDVLNTLATGDEQTTKGKMYQWGRNIPFEAEGTVNTVGGQVSSWDDSRIWSADFISGNAYWHVGNQATDTWRTIMAKAATAPDTYKGTNTSYPGDPSPEGWHIPSRMEWTIILPFSSGGYGFKFSNNYLNRTEEIDLDGDGVGETYVADYKTITENSMVGLKFKGTCRATAFKYEWQEATKSMKISAIQTDASTTIDQIANSSFDWTHAVVRYFPTAGNRYFDNGTIDASYKNVGYYWTSEANNTSYDIWVVYMKTSTAYVTPDDAGCCWSKRGNAYLIRCIKNQSH